MISGTVSADGVPTITVSIAGQDWLAIIDTGFNGDLELPEDLRDSLSARYVGRVISTLGGGQIIEEDAYLVEFPFDSKTVEAEATFVSGPHILIGTHLLREYCLQVNFVSRRVQLEEVDMGIETHDNSADQHNFHTWVTTLDPSMLAL